MVFVEAEFVESEDYAIEDEEPVVEPLDGEDYDLGEEDDLEPDEEEAW